ncbi:MAG: aminodeoxychorismate synthase component I [Kangiellaceae bacterium]|jgi:para-aminobenzoate synthetase component 1|nr:aminodeoxychorismate synthase component I [Kangiellaceae bacterium]
MQNLKDNDQVEFIELDYYEENTAQVYFAPFSQQAYSLLLDSSRKLTNSEPTTQASNQRFDIILVNPNRILISDSNLPNRHQLIDLISGEKSTVSDIFSEIKRQREQHQNNIQHDQVPFTGGWAGAIAYDFGRQLETILEQNEKKLKCPDLILGYYTTPIIIDHHSKTARVYRFSDRREDRVGVQKIVERLSSTQNLNGPIEPSEYFKLLAPWQSNMTEQQYHEKFQQVKNYLESGDCYQVNLAQRFAAPYQGEEWQAYCHLRQTNQAPFSSYFNYSNGVILSLSPERFLQIDNNKVTTQPIKGTRPRDANEAIDEKHKIELLNSEKDRAENLMIVDLLRNDLGRTAVAGSVEVSELFGLHSFTSVHHLISTVESKIASPTQAIDVIKAAFPGGSITGAPKIRAMEIIEELEPDRRHFYCGSMVYLSNNGNADSNIMIRTLLTEDNTIYTWAGGGLVYDSQVDSEYQETFSKLSQILTPLSEFNNESMPINKVEPL